jgi:hypothetical protein
MTDYRSVGPRKYAKQSLVGEYKYPECFYIVKIRFPIQIIFPVVLFEIVIEQVYRAFFFDKRKESTLVLSRKDGTNRILHLNLPSIYNCNDKDNSKAQIRSNRKKKQKEIKSRTNAGTPLTPQADPGYPSHRVFLTRVFFTPQADQYKIIAKIQVSRRSVCAAQGTGTSEGQNPKSPRRTARGRSGRTSVSKGSGVWKTI